MSHPLAQQLFDLGLIDTHIFQRVDPTTPDRALLAALEADQILTRFQVELILAGRAAEIVLGGYVLTARLGAGALGAVFRGRHRVMDRTVAIKVLRPEVIDSAAKGTLLREFQSLARVNHPHLVLAYDAGEDAGRWYLVTEYLDGEDLATLIRRNGPLPQEQALELARQAAVGLAHAHHLRIVHRDVRPSNFWIEPSGRLKVLDLGMSFLLDRYGTADGWNQAPAHPTAANDLAASPHYRAPELARGQIGPEADVYSLAASLWFMLTGGVLFPAPTMTAILVAHGSHPLPDLRRAYPPLSRELEALLRAMLEKNPAARPTMAQVIESLTSEAATSRSRAAGSSVTPARPRSAAGAPASGGSSSGTGSTSAHPPAAVAVNPPFEPDPRLAGSPFDTHQPRDTAAGPRPFTSDPPVLSMLGRYRIVRKLGAGAMGAVYLAEDTMLERKVAIKVLKTGDVEDPAGVERFHREAKVLAALHHPNICPIFDLGEQDGLRYLCMGYVEGQSLAEWLEARGRATPAEAVWLLKLIAAALHEAHRKGVIHRDLKPANVMLNPDGSPIVMDFGLARARRVTQDMIQTQQGDLLGSPAYLSPEQARGEVDQISPASDIYSLGVMLFELLTGEVPFTGPVFQVLYAHAHKPAPLLREVAPHLDPRLEAICAQAMAKAPQERFASARAMVDALTAYEMEARMPAAQVPKTVAPKRPRKSFLGMLARGVGLLLLTAICAMVAFVIAYLFLPDRTPPANATNSVPVASATATTAATGEPSASATSAATTASSSPESTAAPTAETGVTRIDGPSRPEGTAAAAPQPGDVKTNGLGIKFAWIPPGSFLREPPPGFATADGGVQVVTISRGFYLGIHEVTQSEYQHIMGRNPSYFSASGDGGRKIGPVQTGWRPVERVSYQDAEEFCRQLSIRREGKYRLPTEAEWEYACRAGSTTRYHFGNACNGTEANCDGSQPFGTASRGKYLMQTSDVGSYPANAWGLFDMHGNVAEWCFDWSGPYDGVAPRDPQGPETGVRRVVRGGDWMSPAGDLRAAMRSSDLPESRQKGTGFRVLWEAP